MKDRPGDRKYMQRCLELAEKGLGSVAPNPMVGCVIISEDSIIGEGYHSDYGGPHAEVNAIAAVKDKGRLKKARLYVNLEPCSHHGKTPPCSSLIISQGIPEVVIGCTDPNEQVAGNGIKDLQDHGVTVRYGIMEEYSRELNRRFFTHHQKRRPYIILKWAQTRDGFIDIARNADDNSGINWITDTQSRQLVHKWRSEEQAILVGTNTAAMDDPRLTVRDWLGEDPLRLVLDLKGRLSGELNLFNGSIPTLVFTRTAKKDQNNLRFVIVPENTDVISFITEHLHSHEIQSLIVEGGASLLGSFIDRDLWDEARIFTADKEFGEGLEGPVFQEVPQHKVAVPSGELSIYRKT